VPTREISLRSGGGAILERDGTQERVAIDGSHHGVRKNLDSFIGVNSIDKIVRNRGLQRVVSNSECDLIGNRGEIKRRLSSGIAAANDEDVLASMGKPSRQSAPCLGTGCSATFIRTRTETVV
jgi:hypothetical protein